MVCRFAELYNAILAHQGINLPAYDTSRLRAAAAHAGAPILDSGASLHAHPSVIVTDPDSAIEIVGYRGNQGETDTSDGVGSLTLPLSTVDGNTTQVELDTVHRIDIENPLVSMGKLVRIGYQVHLNSPTDAVLYTPQGEEIPIQHGEDDVLYLQPHPHAEKVCQVKSSGHCYQGPPYT